MTWATRIRGAVRVHFNRHKYLKLLTNNRIPAYFDTVKISLDDSGACP
jgi:hypothetical protein